MRGWVEIEFGGLIKIQNMAKCGRFKAKAPPFGGATLHYPDLSGDILRIHLMSSLNANCVANCDFDALEVMEIQFSM